MTNRSRDQAAGRRIARENAFFHNRLRFSRAIKNYINVLKLILIAILSFAAFGQSAKSSPQAGTKKAPAPQGTSAQEDKVIEAAIKAKLEKSKIGKDGFKVHVQGGVATWEGTTDVLQHKGAATRMAKAAGAKAVVNNIKVSDAAKNKAGENLDTGRRRAQVKRSEPRTQQ